LWRRAWRRGTITPSWRSSTAWRPRCTVQHLPGDQRRVVELAYFHGLTCREVALAAGIPEGTVKSRLRLALAKLETMLDRQLLESS
jgi:RNA polymerase sigma-70 factor (ECF subfamily)